MSKVIDFQAAKAKKVKQQKVNQRSSGRQDLMCKNGHHKWRIIKARRFDVKEGRLATLFQCAHCAETKTEYH